MTELFEDDEIDIIEDSFNAEETVDIDTSESTILDARRRLEKKLEEKRLREELDDFVDY
jgi:hypothetical protein